MVKSFRNILDLTPFAKKTELPLPADAAPLGPMESAERGSRPSLYALVDHVHPSKVRRLKLTTATDGAVTWTYMAADGVTPAPFPAGSSPIVIAVAETALGVTDVINVQLEGAPTNASAKLRVTRTQRSVVSLIGLTILSLPASPGATLVHAIAVIP